MTYRNPHCFAIGESFFVIQRERIDLKLKVAIATFMFTELELSAFVIVDKFLSELSKEKKGLTFLLYNKPSEYRLAKQIMDDNQLIKHRNPLSQTSIIDIAPNGIKILKFGGIKKYLESINQSIEEKENLEIQQLRSNNILLTNQLADYGKTKKNLKRTTTATIALAIIALLELVLLLLKSNLF